MTNKTPSSAPPSPKARNGRSEASAGRQQIIIWALAIIIIFAVATIF